MSLISYNWFTALISEMIRDGDSFSQPAHLQLIKFVIIRRCDPGSQQQYVSILRGLATQRRGVRCIFEKVSKIISLNTFKYQEEQMALMTPEQFEESLKQMNPRVYMNGKRVENVLDNPNTRTVVESNKASYRWALDPEYKDIMSCYSPLRFGRTHRKHHEGDQAFTALDSRTARGRHLAWRGACDGPKDYASTRS